MTTLTGRRLAPYGVCAVRALLGVVVTAGYLADHGVRARLWGPASVYPRDLALAERAAGEGFNLFLVSDSTLYFELLFHLGLVAAACVALGLGGRPVLLLCWAVHWSCYRINPVVVDSGDRLVGLVLPMLLLTRCYQHVRVGRPRGPSDRWQLVLVHNVGVLAVALQICIGYLLSGTYKLQGAAWVDGTALRSVLRVPEYYRPGPSDLLLASEVASALAGYAAVALLVFFPVLVLHQRFRPWAVGAMVAFHVSIGVMMGLQTFALTMIACDLVFVDRHVARVVLAVRRTTTRVLSCKRAGTPVAGPSDVTAAAPARRWPR